MELQIYPIQRLRFLCFLISGIVSLVTIGDAGTTWDVSSMSLVYTLNTSNLIFNVFSRIKQENQYKTEHGIFILLWWMSQSAVNV